MPSRQRSGHQQAGRVSRFLARGSLLARRLRSVEARLPELRSSARHRLRRRRLLMRLERSTSSSQIRMVRAADWRAASPTTFQSLLRRLVTAVSPASGPTGGGTMVTYLGYGLRVRSNGGCWRRGGRLRDRREHQLDHGRSASAERRQRRPCCHEPGRTERPSGRRPTPTSGRPRRHPVTVPSASCADGHGNCSGLGLDGRRNGRDGDRNRLRVGRDCLF